MRRNGYLWTSGVNLDTAVRFPVRVLNFGDLATFPMIFAFYILMSAIFLLPVCLTYWPSVDPHVDNFHQVWSSYDHPLPSYSVFVCWYVTWPGDLDFWPFDLEQLSYMAGHVGNPATKFEDPRSWVTSYNGSHWLPLKMRSRPLRVRRITWPVSKGWKTITFLESPTPICLFTIQLLWFYDEYYWSYLRK